MFYISHSYNKDLPVNFPAFCDLALRQKNTHGKAIDEQKQGSKTTLFIALELVILTIIDAQESVCTCCK